MKQIALLLISCLFISVTSCKKENKNPEPDPANNNNNNNNNDDDPPPGSDTKITSTDLLAHYFIIELSSGALRVDYFYTEGTTLKGWRDGLGMRRGMEDLSLSNDTLKYTISGTNVYTYVLQKAANGRISIINTITSTPDVIAHHEIQPVADATPFASTGAENIFRYIKSDGDNVYLYFAFTGEGNVWKHDGVTGASDYMGYYLLHKNLGWKSNDDRTFGVAVSSWKGNNEIDMLIQSSVPELGTGIQAASEF